MRRLAAEEGVDVTQVPATGPGGRLTKGDVLAYLDTPGPGPAKPYATPTAQAARPASPGTTAASPPPAKPASA